MVEGKVVFLGFSEAFDTITHSILVDGCAIKLWDGWVHGELPEGQSSEGHSECGDWTSEVFLRVQTQVQSCSIYLSMIHMQELDVPLTSLSPLLNYI